MMTEQDFKRIEQAISDYRTSKYHPLPTKIDWSVTIFNGVLALILIYLLFMLKDLATTLIGIGILVLSFGFFLSYIVKIKNNTKKNTDEAIRRQKTLQQALKPFFSFGDPESVLNFLKELDEVKYKTKFVSLTPLAIEAFQDLGMTIIISRKETRIEEISMNLEGKIVMYTKRYED